MQLSLSKIRRAVRRSFFHRKRSNILQLLSLTLLILVSQLAAGCRRPDDLSTVLSTARDFSEETDRPDRNPHFLAFKVAYAYPQYVFQGQAVTLSWNAPLAEWVEAVGAGRFNGPTGSIVVYPNTTQDYFITAHNRYTSITRTINVQVIGIPGAIRAFWGDPAAVAIGDEGYLRWDAEYCDFVEIRDDLSNSPFHKGACGPAGEVLIRPTRKTRYFIEAFQYDRGVPTGPGFAGPGNDQTGLGSGNTGIGIPRLVGRSDISIDLLDKAPIVELNASSLNVTAGTPVHLYWSVRDGEGITFDPPVVASPQQAGSADIVLQQSTSIRLSAYSKLLRQRVDRVIDINVVPRFKVDTVQILPDAIQKGRPALISWSGVQCQKVWIAQLSGEILVDNLGCSGDFEVKPEKTTQYIVRFLYLESGVSRVQEVPLTATVYGGADLALPQTSGPAAPSAGGVDPLLPPPPKASEIIPPPPSPVPVVDPRDIPRFISVSANTYSTRPGETVKIQWKTYRTRRVLLIVDDEVISLPPSGTYDLKLTKTKTVNFVAENRKFRSLPTALQITVKEKSNLDILLEVMGAKP